jgi:nitrogen fixation protein FixH
MTHVMARLNWGTGIAAVYTVFALSTLGFVGFAMSRPVDLVSPDYYQRSLRQDQRMAAIDNASRLGAALSVAVDPSTRRLTVTLPGDAPSGTITLYRPSDASSDRRTPLALTHGGQSVDTAGMASGHWVVQLEWTADGRSFYHETPVFLP